jgi:hypothetical protein
MKNLLTKEAFADWCEKQPASNEYSYFDNRGCAFCQYLDALGIENNGVGGKEWWAGTTEHRLPTGVWLPLQQHPRTFGALAQRLRSAS